MVDDRRTPYPGFDWESADDLTDLSDSELRALLGRISREERDAAYRHEVLRGRMALIRAELAGRGIASLSTQELARVLLGEEGRPA